jgi:integrating conjugative element relaxase (TIGR03760 family)
LFNKATTHAPIKPPTGLHEFYPPIHILSEPHREDLLTKIKEYCSFEESKFQALCDSLFTNLTNHCQLLPETLNTFYSSTGGYLDHALNRTEAALDLFKNFILQTEEKITEEQKIWIYVLFSASMLQGIGKLHLDYEVSLYDAHGKNIKIWNSLLENLVSSGKFYSYTLKQHEEDDLRCRINLLLARMLMPVSGFNWIASNPEALEVWLALINEDYQSAGTLGLILIRADAIAIQRDFQELFEQNQGRNDILDRLSTFAENHDPRLGKDKLIGVTLIQWVADSLDKGLLMINKAPLLMVPGGLLMLPDLYKLFIREHPEFKNAQALQKGVLSLGLHERAKRAAATGAATKEEMQGVVLKTYAVALPHSVNVHNSTAGTTTKTSALELIQAQMSGNINKLGTPEHKGLNSLNSEGKWEIAEAHTLVPVPGIFHV